MGLLALAGCSGSGSPTITQGTPSPTASQASSPTPPAPAPSGGSTERPLSRGVLSAWTGCGSGFQCARLTVPLDDAKPALGTIALALTRHRATGSQRVGSLLVNPGGPGDSAIEFLQGSYSDFPAAIRSRFDLVAFDPRGIGRTAPVRCLTTSQLDSYFHLDPVPDNASELAALDAGNKQFADGCRARSARVLPYVSTRIVAQDLDRVRMAVGDAKLTYLGYSYGTAIGASYLDQFPTHVRAMVLDGALDPTLTWDQLLAGQSRGFDGALNAFLANCQKITCQFRKAVSGDLPAAYDRLAAQVEQTALPGSGQRVVGPGEFSYGVGEALYSKSLWPYLDAALTQALHGKGSYLLALSDDYLQRGKNGYSNISEGNFSVNCIDRPWPRTDAPYQALAKQVGKAYPRFGPAIALSGLGCAVWPVGPVSTPHKVVAPTSPAVLVIGTTRDPATPYSWAESLAGQLAHGVLITHRGDGHTVYRSGAPGCIVTPVDSYLISLTVPPPSTC